MFKSKGFIILIILAICIVLISYHIVSNNIESDINTENNSNDTIMMPIQDENGNVKLVPVTNTTAEGSASAP